MKVTTIEEAQNLICIKVDELIGSLQTFEMVLNDRHEKKNKIITFAFNAEEDEDQGEESFSEAITFIGRKFNKHTKCDKSKRGRPSPKLKPDIDQMFKTREEMAKKKLTKDLPKEVENETYKRIVKIRSFCHILLSFHSLLKQSKPAK